MPEGVGYGPQNTASTGLTLNYIGDHAYAYSGGQGMSTADQTALEFQTEGSYLVGNFFFTGATAGGNAGGGISTFAVTFNGETIMIVKLETGTEAMPTYAKCNSLIPPYTKVKVVVDSDTDAASLKTSASYTARGYGKIKE